MACAKHFQMLVPKTSSCRYGKQMIKLLRNSCLGSTKSGSTIKLASVKHSTKHNQKSSGKTQDIIQLKRDFLEACNNQNNIEIIEKGKAIVENYSITNDERARLNFEIGNSYYLLQNYVNSIYYFKKAKRTIEKNKAGKEN